MLAIGRVLDEEAGYTPETAPRGFGFADDNCCLMTPDMYRLFGFPVLEGMFKRYAPGATDRARPTFGFAHGASAVAAW